MIDSAPSGGPRTDHAAGPAAIIVIGASAGGVDALRTLVAAFPAELDAAVFVTLHIGANRSDLPWLLGRASTLAAAHPQDGDAIEAGRIYVAPPDHHMLVERGVVRLSKGPRENCARPAIDPMFRSAARAYGASVIGVVLTGGLSDGTAGLYQIKAGGGTAVVQDPADCVSAAMTTSAIAHVEVDHILAVAAIGPLLAELVAALASNAQPLPMREEEMTADFTHHRPVAVTCPDCGGALRQTALGSIAQFRCHIGHVYTGEIMLAAQFLVMERFLEQALRSMSERGEMCREMAARLADSGREDERALWHAAESEALDQSAPLRALLTRIWIHPAGAAGLEGASM